MVILIGFVYWTGLFTKTSDALLANMLYDPAKAANPVAEVRASCPLNPRHSRTHQGPFLLLLFLLLFLLLLLLFLLILLSSLSFVIRVNLLHP